MQFIFLKKGVGQHHRNGGSTSWFGIYKFIKANLLKATYVIQIITDNYKNSEVCLNEMGAAWVTGSKVFPFIVNPVQYENVSFIHQPNQLLKLNEKRDILKFVDEIKEEHITRAPLTEVNRHVEDFLRQIKKELKSNIL